MGFQRADEVQFAVQLSDNYIERQSTDRFSQSLLVRNSVLTIQCKLYFRWKKCLNYIFFEMSSGERLIM